MRCPVADGENACFVHHRMVARKISAGIPCDQVYGATMYVLRALLVGGLIANFLVKPLAEKWFMSEEEVAALQARSPPRQPKLSVRSVSVVVGSMAGRSLPGRRHSHLVGARG